MITAIEHKRYKKITDNSDYFFFLSSNSLRDDISFIKKNGIANVCLSQYENYTLLDVLPIVGIDCIRNLRIYVKKIDLRGLSNLTSLEELSIGEEYDNLTFNNLFNLQSLYLVNGKFSGLQTLKRLKELTIINGNAAAFSVNNFMENSPIESLSIYNTKGQIDFSFLLRLNNLKKLDLYNVKAKIDVRLFNSFAETLAELKIEKCKELEHLDDCLAKFISLKYLSLIDSVSISNAETLSQLKSIEIAVVLGTSYFIDGNINWLKDLRHVSIDDKKHYSLKNDQLPKLPYE
jgi:hypothetical protein